MKPTSRKTFFTRAFSFLLFLLPFTFFLFKGCERNFSPYGQGGIRLTAEYAAVTEAWLRVQVDRLPSDGIITLLRDDSLVYRGALHRRDTTLLDSGLAPNAAYRYRAALWQGGRQLGFSPPITVTTMDTTSHDFVWEVVEFPSPFCGGVLYDVAIVNENDIWAVGKIYADSAKPYLPYNAVHWDGNEWELRRVTVQYKGSEITPSLNGIFAFSKNDIWVTSGVPKHWDGSKWTQYHLWDMGVLGPDDGGVTKIWGSSSDNLYFVGRGGTIVHYDGVSWQRIESGTEVDLLDIWGNPDSRDVWVCGWKDFKPTILLKGQGEQWKTVFNTSAYLFTYHPDTLSGGILSIWVNDDAQLYALTWFDLYRYRETPHFIKPLWGRNEPQIWASNSIRGTAFTNIFTVGNFGLIWHFNGYSWRQYQQLINSSDRLKRVAVKDNLVVAVGYRYFNPVERLGIIYIGRR